MSFAEYFFWFWLSAALLGVFGIWGLVWKLTKTFDPDWLIYFPERHFMAWFFLYRTSTYIVAVAIPRLGRRFPGRRWNPDYDFRARLSPSIRGCCYVVFTSLVIACVGALIGLGIYLLG